MCDAAACRHSSDRAGHWLARARERGGPAGRERLAAGRRILGGEPEPEQSQPGPGLATSKPNRMFDIESMPDLLRPCGAGQYSGQAGGARGDETYQLIQATSNDIGGRRGTLSFTASQS